MTTIQMPGLPSPEGNPIIKSIYGKGGANVLIPRPPTSFALGGNRRFVPIAPWSAVRVRLLIDQNAGISLAFAGRDQANIDTRQRATETLTFAANPGNTETVTLGGDTYTFQTVLTDVQGNVLIGATLSESIDNLVAHITEGAGKGTVYANAGIANFSAMAAKTSGTTMLATAVFGGVAGNGIVSTETLAAGSWGGATLSGGVNGDIAADDGVIVANTPLMLDISATEHIGEPFLDLSLYSLTSIPVVTYFDVMGSSF